MVKIFIYVLKDSQGLSKAQKRKQKQKKEQESSYIHEYHI